MTFNDHYSVLLKESVDALISTTAGVYIDGTFGRGGHSREILARLSGEARLIAFDKDPEAVSVGQKLEQEDKRFTVVHGAFVDMQNAIAVLGITQVNGIVLDLGVSSPQLDDAERGFSFLRDGPLDMRMNNSAGQTAAQWIASAKEEDIAHVIKTYGEERFGKRMARAIVTAREEAPILRTSQLASIVSEANPKWEKGKHPATRAFQAIRIYINGELAELERSLENALATLVQGGRMVVISFHSLEDRIVKRFFRDQAKGQVFPSSVPVTEGMLNKTIRVIGKAYKAGEEELDQNIRSRSAIMRVAEKL